MIRHAKAEESGKEIWFINRTVLVLRTREPFDDWARGTDDGAAEAYDSSGGWTNSYLIPEFESEEEAWEWLEANCGMIFEMELDSWYSVPEVWPEDRSWNAFREWFDVELIETAWDLVDEPLSSDPPDLSGGAEA